MRIRLTEKLGNEAKYTVTQQKNRRHLSRLSLLAGIQPQQDKQQQAFHQELIHLRRVPRQVARTAKHHAPRQAGVCQSSPQLAIDEITHAPGRQPRGHTWRHKISHLQERPLARHGEPDHGPDYPQHAAMKAHATLPHGKNLQRMGQVIAGLVKQAITNTPTKDNAHHAQKQDVLHVASRPGAWPGDGSKRWMPEAAHA